MVTNTQTYLLPGHNESTPTTRKIRPATHERRKGLPEERRVRNQKGSNRVPSLGASFKPYRPTTSAQNQYLLARTYLSFPQPLELEHRPRLNQLAPDSPIQSHIIPKPTAQEKETQLNSAIQALDKQRKKEPAHHSQTTSPGDRRARSKGESPNTRAANQHPTISNPKIPTIQIPHVLTHRI